MLSVLFQLFQTFLSSLQIETQSFFWITLCNVLCSANILEAELGWKGTVIEGAMTVTTNTE